MRDEFIELLVARYSTIKSQYAGEGRRKWHLRVLQEFWTLSIQPGSSNGSVPKSLADEFLRDGDPLDTILDEGPELGVLLRTDYSNEEAWRAFSERLHEAETVFAGAMSQDDRGVQEDLQSQSASTEDLDVKMQDGNGDSDSDEAEGIPSPIIKVINPTSTQDRAIFSNISNLSALRLMNNVDIRTAPSLPAGTKRITPPNRLIDQRGWQEIYSGMNIWIYDAQSNADQCVRLVGQEGDVYGTATGDSWRARVTHICELQFNMFYLGMKIDFGGLDRWDYNERRRNLREANLPIS